jgi:hypothetical protein
MTRTHFESELAARHRFALLKALGAPDADFPTWSNRARAFRLAAGLPGNRFAMLLRLSRHPAFKNFGERRPQPDGFSASFPRPATFPAA